MEMRMPAIRYRQGSRTMYVTAGSPAALVKLCEAPKPFDPQHPDEPGNRPLDKSHLQGIVQYLETEPDFVIGSVTLYVRKGTVKFHRIGDYAGEEVAELGWVSVPIDVKFEIGDGQHRLNAYARIFNTHEQDDPVVQNLRSSGTPAIIVEEDDPAKMAQDFVDLQRNGKPLSSSLGAYLDRRLLINRLAFDLARELNLFNDKTPGDRIEYLAQTLGKHSPKLYTFASWRFAVGTVLIGFGERTRKKWEQKTHEMLSEGRFDSWKQRLHDIFEEASQKLPGWRDVLTGDMKVPEFREKFVLGSSAGLTAFAGAMHEVINRGIDWKEAIDRMAGVDWLKESEKPVFFEGTIVQDGRIISNRPAFEAAAQRLVDVITLEETA